MATTDAAWSKALTDRFYREEFANRPVFLCVDDETLAAISRDEGLASDDAAQSLASAVRQRVRIGAPLDAWTRDAVAWRRSGCTGPPPFLSVLAVTVLAATTTGDRNGRGYYPRLNELLDLPGRGMPRYFDSDIQQLWRCLNEWLADVEQGRRGLPTATNLTSAQANVGWALSQTVLRPADRTRLPLLFSMLGLSPGQQVDGQLLAQSLRRTGLAGHGLSRRLTQVLDDPPLADNLASTLAKELNAWDGSLRDESGRRALQLLLTYHDRARTFGVAVRTPTDLTRRSLMVGGESAAVISLGETGDLLPLPVPVTAALLDGASLPAQVLPADAPSGTASELHLVMTRSDLRILTPSDGLARWVEVRPAERHRRHLVVVRSELADGAVGVMGSLAQAPPQRTTSVPCPPGWMGYVYEPVRAAASDTLVGSLSMLSPRGGEIAALEGGLAVSARSRLYLTVGPPDVLFDLSDGGGSVDVDGQPVGVGSAGRLRLAGRGLIEGTHEVNVGGAHLKLRLVDEHALGPAAGTLGIRLQAGTTTSGRPWTVPLRPAAGDEFDSPAANADIMVQGAAVERSAAADALPHSATGLGAQARAGGQHYALGPPGTAARIHPQPPAWLLALVPPPIPHMVDLTDCASPLPFTPRWFLRIAQDHASVVPASIGSCTRSADDVADMAGAGETAKVWDEVLPYLANAAIAPGQAEAWLDFVTSPDGASPDFASPDAGEGS